jgi:cell fate (sporulation/competence/biofilm development) regulator YlbF (YheA/YmcA/DUF963 family)
VVVVVAFLLVVMSVPFSVGAGATTTGGAAADADGSAALAGVGSPMLAQQENNTTVRHEDPDATDENGDIAAIRRQLAGQMNEITVDCSEGISVGNYDACEEIDEDGEYGDALSKYVEVTGRDGGGEDSETAESYRDLQEEQQEFANETSEFRQTYQEYQEARRNGNTSRARQLARELLELREDIQRTGTNVSRSSTEVSNRTGVSLASVEQNTQSVSRNVSNTTETVATAVFVPTEMTATREGAGNISAREPLVVSGTVQTTNGSRVPNGSVVLATGPGRDAPVVSRTRTPVNASGAYRLTYQPTAIQTGNRTLSVRYVPPATSVYRVANVSVQATVEGVQATVSLQDVNDSAQYGDTVGGVATLEIAEDGANTSLPEVPLTASLGGRELVSSRTGPNGSVALRGPLPARIDSGVQTLRVRGPSSGRAVVVEPMSREVRVQSSATQLDARVVQTAIAERRVRVVGQLVARGEGVPEQEIVVRIGGEQVRTLQTNASGYYRGTVTIPNASFPATGQASLGVVVAYDGTGTNLESARTRQDVVVRSGVAAESSAGDRIVGFVSSNPIVVGAVVGLTLLAAGGFVAMRRRRTGEDVDATGEDSERSSGADAVAQNGSAGSEATNPNLETIRDALSDGAYSRAVLSGYAALRQGLAVTEGPATHWEFYRMATESGLSEAQLDALREVTEAFEQVSFAGQTPDEETAATVLERVRAALDKGESGVDAAGADD